jgi:glycosyltransferase involved in cell wall biosynthesis
MTSVAGSLSETANPLNKQRKMERLRVLHLYSSISDGGGAVSVSQTLTALSERGHSCHLSCRPDARILTRLNGTGCIAHVLPLRNALDIRSLFKLRRLIRDHRVNLIHAHNGRDYPMAVLVSTMAGIPCVFSRHYYRLNRNPLTRILFRRVALVISVSRSLAKKMARELKVDPKRIRYIPNWAVLHAPPPSDASWIRHQFGLRKDHVVAVIGGINKNKGQKEFVDAAIAILQQRDDVNFIIVGANQEVKSTQFFQHLRNTISSQGREKDILFFDWVPDVQKILPAITVTVVPSRNEAFGRIAMESMAAGVPVVVTNVGGLKEIVCDGETGLIAKPDDSEDLAVKIQKLLNDADMRKRLSSKARQVLVQEFSKDVVVASLEQAYHDSLRNHGKHHFAASRVSLLDRHDIEQRRY